MPKPHPDTTDPAMPSKSTERRHFTPKIGAGICKPQTAKTQNTPKLNSLVYFFVSTRRIARQTLKYVQRDRGLQGEK